MSPEEAKAVRKMRQVVGEWLPDPARLSIPGLDITPRLQALFYVSVAEEVGIQIGDAERVVGALLAGACGAEAGDQEAGDERRMAEWERLEYLERMVGYWITEKTLNGSWDQVDLRLRRALTMLAGAEPGSQETAPGCSQDVPNSKP